MQGAIDFREATLWVQANSPTNIKLTYWKHKDSLYTTQNLQTNYTNHYTGKLILDNVEPGSTYSYSFVVNGKKQTDVYKIVIPALWLWRTKPKDFGFAIGSCHYSNEPIYDRPGKAYGDSVHVIFNSIADKNPELMLWLGDNIYLREPDWNTKTGIYKRYTHMRTNPALKKLLTTCPNYAIWDDHDFGPNDGDRSFWNKETTLQAFKDFWANPGYGVNGQKGITTYFQREDAAFYLLDNRYNRSPNKSSSPDKTILGENQLQWLKDNLLSSKASFKFVVIGGQFLNTAAKHENYANYPKERLEIIEFIQKNKIKNVVFLTGDRHHSEISKLEKEGVPTIYDITVSPLTSGAGNAAKYETNTLQVNGSLISGKRNFAILSLSGELKDRVLTVTYYNKAGTKLYNYQIEKE